MATYYWVGGNGTWNNVSTTNWATVSGGAIGWVCVASGTPGTWKTFGTISA